MTSTPTRSAVEATVAGKVDASSEAVRARIGLLEADYAADGAGFDAKLLDALLTRAENAEAERDEAKRDAERLSGAVYVPGRWQCKKCGFGLMQMKLRASDGAIGVRDDPGGYCPNDGSPLWRVTEREAGNELVDRAQEYLKRAVDAESDLAAARETIAAKDAEIARLTAEVQAAREDERGACAAKANIVHPEGVFKWQNMITYYEAGYGAGARKQAEYARDAILARANPKEPTT